MSDDGKCYAATPAATLEEHILNSNIAKSDTEWWAHHEITRLRAELAAALNAAATEKTLREHETKRANDNYASLTKHWLNESKLRELLTEIVEYNGGAGHALEDEYVVARIDAALGVGDE